MKTSRKGTTRPDGHRTRPVAEGLERAGERDALVRLALVLCQTTTLRASLDAVLSETVVAAAADGGAVYFRDGDRLRLLTQKGGGTTDAEQPRSVPCSDEDLPDSTVTSGRSAGEIPPFIASLVGASRSSAWVAVPMRTDRDRLGLVVLLRRSAQPFSSREVRRVETIVAATMPAVEKVCLFEQVLGSRHKFRELFDTAPDGYLAIDAGGRIEEINDTALRWLGYDRTEAGELTVSRIIGPKSRGDIQCLLPQYLGDAVVRDLSLELRCKDGRPLQVLVNTVAIFGEDGRPASSRCLMRDISEVHRLQERNALLASVVENVNEMVVATDPAGRVLYANPETGRALGITAGMTLGRNVIEFIAEEDRTRVGALLESAAALRQWRGEVKLKAPDGRHLPCETSAAAIFDETGAVRMIIAVAQDISERRQMREETAFRSALLENASDSIFVHDAEGRIVYANERAWRDRGYARDELLSMRMVDIEAPEAHYRRPEVMHDLNRSGSVQFVSTHTCKDRRRFSVEVRSQFIHYGGKQVILSIARDLSERLRAEEQLRYLADLIANVNDAIISADTEQRVVSWNAAAERIYGVPAAEAIGRLLPDVYRYEFQSPEQERLAYESLYQRGLWKGDVVHHTRDGQRLDINVSVSLLRNAAGEPTGVVSINRDITERKRAEEEIRRLKELYEIVTHGIPSGTLLHDRDLRVVFVNDAFLRIVGLSRNDLLGQRLAEVSTEHALDADAVRKVSEQLCQVRDTAQPVGPDEMRLLSPSGEKVLELSFHPILDKDGRAEFVLQIVEDITARREAEEEKRTLEEHLFQAQKLESIGRLAGGIAHDFNNLLGGILGFASYMRTQIDESHSLFRAATTIEQSAEQAAELTGRLLGFARGGKYEVAPRDVNAILHEVLTLLSRMIEKTIVVETDFDDALPPILGDRGQLHQAFLNLCLNARDAMPNGGRLTVRTRSCTVSPEFIRLRVGAFQGPAVQVAICDTGVGMTEEVKRRIFEPFFSTKPKGQGTGLGLATVYGIVKNHGGFIDVVSAPGEGSSFTLWLPACDKAVCEEAPAVPPVARGRETILVVDDERVFRELAREALTRFGYHVLAAETGEEALRLYEQRRQEIDLVVLDIVMPGMGGKETFERLKALDPGVRVLLSSGYSREQYASEMLTKGALGFIPKPYRIEQLSSVIRNTLDGKH